MFDTGRRGRRPLQDMVYGVRASANMRRISHRPVGATIGRPRTCNARPYEDDFLSVGKTCFMEGTPFASRFLFRICGKFRTDRRGTPVVARFVGFMSDIIVHSLVNAAANSTQTRRYGLRFMTTSPQPLFTSHKKFPATQENLILIFI